MISQDTIDKIVAPIVDAQEDFSFSIIKQIAIRIKQIGNLPYSSALTLVRSLFVGDDLAAIQKNLITLKRLQFERIETLINSIAQQLYIEARPLYKFRGLPCTHFKHNDEICDLVKLIIDEIEDEYLGYTDGWVFVIRNQHMPTTKAPLPVNSAYQSVLSEAAQLRRDPKTDYNKLIASTINDLVSSGLRYVRTDKDGKLRSYKVSGLLQTLLLEKTKELNIKMQEIMAKQFDADGIELSAHINSAPDHEPVQGRQFANEEFEKLQTAQMFQDVDGTMYLPIARPIGAWNCRHWTRSIIIGISRPQYTDKQLKTMAENNAKGYTAPNGKHYTMYECTQTQNNYERLIAKDAQGIVAAKLAGNTELEKSYRAKYSQHLNSYRAFSKACGLPINRHKLP